MRPELCGVSENSSSEIVWKIAGRFAQREEGKTTPRTPPYMPPACVSLCHLLLSLLLDGLRYARVGQGRGVAKLLALGDVLQEASHDFAALRLGQILNCQNLLRLGRSPCFLPHALPEFLHQLVAVLLVALEDHEAHGDFAFLLVALADDRRLSDALVPDQHILDLNRGYTVARDVHHVVDASGYGVAARLITLGPVLDVVCLLVYLGEVLLLVALGVLPQGPEHGGPRLVYGQCPASRIVLDELLVLLVPQTEEDARERVAGAAGHGRGDAWQRCDHDRPRLGLPPRVNDRTPAASHVLVEPYPSFGVYWLACRPEQPQTGEVMPL